MEQLFEPASAIDSRDGGGGAGSDSKDCDSLVKCKQHLQCVSLLVSLLPYKEDDRIDNNVRGRLWRA